MAEDLSDLARAELVRVASEQAARQASADEAAARREDLAAAALALVAELQAAIRRFADEVRVQAVACHRFNSRVETGGSRFRGEYPSLPENVPVLAWHRESHRFTPTAAFGGVTVRSIEFTFEGWPIGYHGTDSDGDDTSYRTLVLLPNGLVARLRIHAPREETSSKFSPLFPADQARTIPVGTDRRDTKGITARVVDQVDSVFLGWHLPTEGEVRHYKRTLDDMRLCQAMVFERR